MEKKKVYYISDIAKASERYDENIISMVDNIAKTAIFGVAAALTIWMPLLLKINPNMDVVDQAKSLLVGIGVPIATIPFAIINLKNAIFYGKEAKKESKFISKYRKDITDEEIENYKEYMDDMKKNNMCITLNK